MDKKRKLQNQLLIILNKVKTMYLKETLMSVYPNINWSSVMLELHESKISLSKKNIVIAATKKILDTEQIHDIPSKISHLRLIVLSKSIKNWRAYRMNAKRKEVVDSEEIFSYLRRNLKIRNTKVDVALFEKSGKLWISVECTQKSNKSRIYYFMTYRDQNYIFANTKNIPNSITDVIAESLGYSNLVSCNLSSKSIDSLLHLLKYKKRKAHTNNAVKNDITFDIKSCKINNEFIDFTFSKEKKEYIDNVLGKQPPALQYLAFETKNTLFKGSLQNFNEIFETRIEFQSPDVFNMLKNMIEKEIIPIPIPHYMQNVMTAGKNDIRLRRDNN